MRVKPRIPLPSFGHGNPEASPMAQHCDSKILYTQEPRMNWVDKAQAIVSALRRIFFFGSLISYYRTCQVFKFPTSQTLSEKLKNEKTSLSCCVLPYRTPSTPYSTALFDRLQNFLLLVSKIFISTTKLGKNQHELNLYSRGGVSRCRTVGSLGPEGTLLFPKRICSLLISHAS